MKKLLQQTLKQILINMGIKDVDPQVEIPAGLDHGDYTTNIAMVLAKRLKRNPIEIAKEIVKKIKDQKSKIKADKSYHSSDEGGQKLLSAGIEFSVLQDIEKVEVVPPGFINFWLALPVINNYMQRVLTQFQISKINPPAGGQISNLYPNLHLPTRKIMVEFAHPNTHKAFHIGHMRNITTGESIIRLLEAVGHKVIRANYQGDVGMHIAKAIYGLSQISNSQKLDIKEKVELLGRAYAAGSKAFDDPSADGEKAKETIKDYNFLVYAAAQRFQKEHGIEQSSTDYLHFVKDRQAEVDEIYELWKETRQWSLDYFESIYKRLGSRYDRYYFESECLAGVDLARDAVKKGVLTESEGAIIFNGKPYGLDTRVFVNSLGLPTYEGKELALAKTQFTEFSKLDLLIHVLGPEQVSFTNVTFKVEELLGIQKNQQLHLVYGWVKLKHGKMSSRSGNVVLGEWLIDEAKKEIYNILQKSMSKSTKADQALGSDLEVRLLANKGLTLSEETNSQPASAESFGEAKEEIAEKAAIAAVKYSFLKVSTRQEISFDIEESVNFNGDSGPYIQYTYARCKSVLRKAGEERLASSVQSPVKNVILERRDVSNNTSRSDRIPLRDSITPSGFQNDMFLKGTVLNNEERLVLRKLYQFPEVVLEAANNYAPNMICEYTYDLASLYNTFYNKHTILGNASLPPLKLRGGRGSYENKSAFRLQLTAATAEILKQGLYLLGIETLERM